MSFKDTLIAAFNEGSYEVGNSDPNTELGIDAVIHVINKTIATLPKFDCDIVPEREVEDVSYNARMVATESGEWINSFALEAILK